LLLFVLAAFAVFMALPCRVAMLIVFFGGWIVLPFGVFPAVAPGTLAWWVTGLALPGNQLVSKAWVAPVVALAGGLICDKRLRWSPALSPLDVPILAWCLWPLAASMISREAAPPALIASAYLAGAWSAPWAIGRIWFSSDEGQATLLVALAMAGVACLPFAVVEAIHGPFLHDWLYSAHPFRFDGDVRYVGHRPLGMFEHGNQYGIWVASCAVGAIGWARMINTGRRVPTIFAGVTSVIALASQSVGAIVLWLLSAAAILFWPRRAMRYAVFCGGIALMLAGAAQLTGLVPVRQIAEQTWVGQHALAAARATGRGSFTWRIAQDLKTIDEVHAAPIAGSGRWDWWRGSGTRPWGLWMLIAGQYGLIGTVLALASLVTPAIARIARDILRPSAVVVAPALVLAVICLAAATDAMLNAFLFFPAMLAAGAIAVRMPRSSEGGET
jgi:hypothetical protein